jgi:hypothetical protein
MTDFQERFVESGLHANAAIPLLFHVERHRRAASMSRVVRPRDAS